MKERRRFEMETVRKIWRQLHGRHRRAGVFLGRLALCAAVFLTACGAGTAGNADVTDDSARNGGAVNHNSTNAGPGREWIYVPERIEIADDRVDYANMQLIGDTVCYLSMRGESGDEAQAICRYSLTDRELKSFPIEWKDDGDYREISCYSFDESYNVRLVVNVYSGGFDQFRRFLCQFGPDGKAVFCTEVTEQLGGEASVSGMAVDREGRIYVFSPEGGIALYAQDGSCQGRISYGSSGEVLVKGAAAGEDGRLYICICKGEDADHCILAELDFERRQLTETIKDFPLVNAIGAGSGREDGDPAGRHDFLLCDDIAAYGYDLAKQEAEELFLWGDSDINGYFVEYLGQLGDGRYFCAVDDRMHDASGAALLTRTKAEEVPGRLELALATVDGGSELASMAVDFNRNSSQYHVTVKKYGALTDLYNAILAGEAIDLIDLSGIHIENLSRQGVFEDLSPYLEQSENVSAADFLDGILDVYTFHGALVGIPESFGLRTVVGGKSMLGGAAGLTLDRLFEIAAKRPGAMPFDGVTREEIIQYLVMFNEDDFLDWETGMCYFDSARFASVLEFAKQFPDARAASAGDGREEASLPSRLQNGNVLFAIADMKGLKDFQLYEEIFGGDAACVGFPATEGAGGTLLFADNAFGIVAGSENKGGAWEFIESVLRRKDAEGMRNEDVYHAYYYDQPGQFPTRKKALSAIEEHIREMDKGGHFGTRFYSDGWQYTTHALTQDEINVVLGLIPNAKPCFSVKDDVVIRIIYEEAEAYFSGQKGLDDVAGVIQNRVKLYMSENS